MCVTPVLESIDEMIRLKSWPRELGHEIDRIINLIEGRLTLETFDCPNFTVTYQTSGPNAVNLDSSAMNVLDPGTSNVLGTIPAGTVPTYVRLICWWLERALPLFINAPFSLRNPAASGKIPVYINQTQFGSASQNNGITIGKALNPGILAAVSVHELFHMVQFEYSLSGPWRPSLLEGGAVLAEDTVAEKMNHYLYVASSDSGWTGDDGVLLNPNFSLKLASYNCALFWRYISEQQSADITEPFVGVEAYRALIEECEASGCSTAAVRTAVRNLPWYQDLFEFHYLDAARQDRTSSETTFGNYALACYLKDLGTNVPDRRFDFSEDEENIAFDDILSSILTVPAASTLVPVDIAGSGTVSSSSSVGFVGCVNEFASQYYEIEVDASISNFDIHFRAYCGFTSLIFQVALIDEDGQVRDIFRTDTPFYDKRITNLADSKALEGCTRRVGLRDERRFLDLGRRGVASPDVMVTRWHSAIKTEYEIDSFGWAWTWVSPDVWVDNDGNGFADSEVYFNFDNKLHIRLHNKGNADASGIQLEFFYQDASTGLSDSGWLPVRNKAGAIQTLSGLSLVAASSDVWSVDWSPAPSGTSNHFCIRAIVTVLGDPNVDNKRVLSNFGNVKVKSGMWVDVAVLRRNILERRLPIDLEVVSRLPVDLDISLRDLRANRTVTLNPAEAVTDIVRISHLAGLKMDQKRVTPLPPVGRSADRLQRLGRKPDPRGFYPTDPRALPPGVAGKPMVTIVHRSNGLALGGVTFLVSREPDLAVASDLTPPRP